jgi:hypothetical protein
LGHHEDVAEDDRGINADLIDRLERDFHRQLRRSNHGQKIGSLAYRAICRQVPPSLAHHPDRRPLDGFAPAGSEEEIIHERSAPRVLSGPPPRRHLRWV